MLAMLAKEVKQKTVITITSVKRVCLHFLSILSVVLHGIMM